MLSEAVRHTALVSMVHMLVWTTACMMGVTPVIIRMPLASTRRSCGHCFTAQQLHRQIIVIAAWSCVCRR